jgi:hypothetical protein
MGTGTTTCRSYRNKFHIKDFSLITLILDIDINNNITKGVLYISQKQKIINLAHKFNLTHHKPLRCPLPVGTNLHISARAGLKY